MKCLDQYEVENRQALTARYAELGGGLSALGDRPPERWWRTMAKRYAAREREALLAMWADLSPFVDHRPLGWESTSATDGVAARTDGAWAGSSDMWCEVDEVLASDERVLTLRFRWAGTSDGIKWELPLGVVTVIERGLTVRWE